MAGANPKEGRSIPHTGNPGGTGRDRRPKQTAQKAEVPEKKRARAADAESKVILTSSEIQDFSEGADS